MAIIKISVIHTHKLHSENNFWVLLQDDGTQPEHPAVVQRREAGLVSHLPLISHCQGSSEVLSYKGTD